MRVSCQAPSSPRRGFSVLEALGASVLVFVAVGIYAGLHLYRARTDQGIVSRLAALDECRLAMETLITRPFDQLAPTAGSVTVTSLPYASAGAALPSTVPISPFRALHGAALAYEIRPYDAKAVATGDVARELRVEAAWREDGMERRVRLVTVRTASLLGSMP